MVSRMIQGLVQEMVWGLVQGCHFTFDDINFGTLKHYGLFTLLDRDSAPNLGTDISPIKSTAMIRDLDLDQI